MKTFKDLVFNPHPNKMGGVQARMDFDNGYGVSVIQTPYSYGGDKGLYELAVFKDDSIHYENSVANGDVVGRLNEDEVTKLIQEVEDFK
jgi:hypothetical protein